VGTAIVAAALLTLGWTKEIVSALLPADSEFSRTLTIFVAVMALYVTDFAINAGKDCPRSLSTPFMSCNSVLRTTK
jgi:solute carrier family 45 protein 1/2/4